MYFILLYRAFNNMRMKGLNYSLCHDISDVGGIKMSIVLLLLTGIIHWQILHLAEVVELSHCQPNDFQSARI